MYAQRSMYGIAPSLRYHDMVDEPRISTDRDQFAWPLRIAGAGAAVRHPTLLLFVPSPLRARIDDREQGPREGLRVRVDTEADGRHV